MVNGRFCTSCRLRRNDVSHVMAPKGFSTNQRAHNKMNFGNPTWLHLSKWSAMIFDQSESSLYSFRYEMEGKISRLNVKGQPTLNVFKIISDSLERSKVNAKWQRAVSDQILRLELLAPAEICTLNCHSLLTFLSFLCEMILVQQGHNKKQYRCLHVGCG